MRNITSLGLAVVCACLPCLSGCGSITITSDRDRSAIFEKIAELNKGGKPVSIAVLCEARTSLSFEHIVILGYDQRGWPMSLCAQAQGKLETRLLDAFGASKGFRLVDRSRMANVLAEQKLVVSGIVSQDTQLKLGQMAGASHLLVVEQDVDGKPGLLDDASEGLFGEKKQFPKITRTDRLIETQSGTVLATEQREL